MSEHPIIDRPKYMDAIRPFIGKNLIKVLVGARRCGKSTLLKQVASYISAKKKRPQLLSINFESANYDNITNERALKDYVANNVSSDRPVALFFDEIQEVDGWEKALRSFMVDYDADIYITGSNASLLSGDLATHITGRYVCINVFPFSFEEYVAARMQQDSSESKKELFKEYVQQGGFPFQCQLDFAKAPTMQYLQDVFSTILFKDILVHYGFRDSDSLDRIIRYVIEQVGHQFSAKNISEYLKSERRSISLDTVYAYVKAAEQACLLHVARRVDALGKQALKFNEKIFIVDHGLRAALGYSNESSIDQVLENIVYLELVRRGYSVSVGKVGNSEVDFVASRDGELEYFQVCYMMGSQEVRDREFGSLARISDNFPKVVLSLDEIEFKCQGMVSKNLIDWLLEDS